MVEDLKIEKALITAAKDYLTVATTVKGEAGQPVIASTDVAVENRLFDHSGKALWCSVFFVPNIPEGRTVGLGGYDRATGFLQIDFNIAAGVGTGILKSWENKARLYFPPGESLEYDGYYVTVTACGMSQGRHIDNFYRKSLTISYRSNLKRATG